MVGQRDERKTGEKKKSMREEEKGSGQRLWRKDCVRVFLCERQKELRVSFRWNHRTAEAAHTISG